ncbi:alpha-L-fucosidase [Opitutaceae bacterium TAV4]|uniref:alpha-L-fucosidase n=1 Tax=Geminisphaera colitermitum TaxID=1148786 RepID=UPI000158CB7B|nr:alpha-L-fucosidase [Geminisphaera colitermitum]RRJ96930.1 alpha-L-fucosidase [Opitutaceae bacterium TAV4]RRK00954.1 alpha-L-fucosidase [Opitutaceae bacterium TAV3]
MIPHSPHKNASDQDRPAPANPHAWFREATYGLFIHWGPASRHGRGEQILMRDLRDQREYARQACAWNPSAFDAGEWARIAMRGGFRYAVLVTRHHDGFCIWDTDTTDYSSASQAAGRDFVREYVEAFRAAGLRVGLYYSWNDFRIPAMFAGPKDDPAGWARFCNYTHAQVRELMTRYGKIDLLWFDGVWPGSAADWRSAELVEEVRRLQPGILINNRLGFVGVEEDQYGAGGDFGTPEHHSTALPGRLWESCQVSTWRLWGYCPGERWRAADVLLDSLTEASTQGGNLLLNVGPDAEGRIPAEFVERSNAIGDWLRIHGEAVYGTETVAVGECTLFGRQTRRGNTLYLIIRFWPGSTLRFQGLATSVRRATLLTTGREISCRRDDGGRGIILEGLPETSPHPMFPVIRLELDGEPRTLPTFLSGMWGGNPARLLAWARERGDGVMADGSHRPITQPLSRSDKMMTPVHPCK